MRSPAPTLQPPNAALREGLLSFRATIHLRGINPYILINPRRAQALRSPWRKPMPVYVQLNGQPASPWRVNLMPEGDGSFVLYLAFPLRKAAGVGVGDEVKVYVAFDANYRAGPLHPTPPWFSDALASHPQAKASWKRLAPSRQKEILRYFAALKSREARDRNLRRALAVLSGQPGRFMARSWNSPHKRNL